MILVFDACCEGFMRWARKRLKLLSTAYEEAYGVTLEVRRVPNRRLLDPQIVDYVRGINAWLVTHDRKIGYDKVIVLPQEWKYEKQYTFLVKEIHRIRGAMSRVRGFGSPRR